ncbi:MAG: hypothetical protein AAB664_04410, partial [Patescibacteria group bacterium]
MPTNLEQSILRTLCWFSVFDRPITRFEIWKWLLEPDRAYDLAEVYRTIESSEWIKERTVEKDGFYQLRKRFVGAGLALPAGRQVPAHHMKEEIETRSKNYL